MRGEGSHSAIFGSIKVLGGSLLLYIVKQLTQYEGSVLAELTYHGQIYLSNALPALLCHKNHAEIPLPWLPPLLERASQHGQWLVCCLLLTGHPGLRISETMPDAEGQECCVGEWEGERALFIL